MAESAEREIASNPWSSAVKLLTHWLESAERADSLLEQLPKTLAGIDRSRVQSLLYGAIRHYGRLDRHVQNLISRPPRARLRAILLIAGFELLEGGDEHHLARVVHHAVEQAKTLASAPEARLVNAVVRKLGPALAAEQPPAKLASAEELAAFFSHPEWLVRRWLTQLGASSTRALLEWNQRPALVFARWRRLDREPNEEELGALSATSWKNHYEVRPGHWPQISKMIADGSVYLQDPATRLAIDLLDPRPGETILDACAAPGGKSVAIADRLLATAAAVGIASGTQVGRIVAVDLPTPRIDRLKENLARVRGVNVALVQADLTDGAGIMKLHDLPLQYSAVMIDVPCSNTGVMRHRVDVKWRLQDNDFQKHARQQLDLLGAASRFVAPKGRIVYSTCSLDTAENETVVNAFVERSQGHYTLATSQISRPWESGHDGAAVFLIERTR
jgi:16S rRNA (cytosine967-C5)-methyltransferase